MTYNILDELGKITFWGFAYAAGVGYGVGVFWLMLQGSGILKKRK